MVSAADLKIYKTTNNLGGAITGTLITPATPNNLFSNIPKNEVVVGEDYYACCFFKNGNNNESMDNFKLWLSSKSNPSNTTVKWAFDPIFGTILFDGTDDYIDLTNDATLWSQSLTKFSFSVWIYPTAGWDTNFREVVYHSGGTNQGFKLTISGDTANKIIFTIKNATGTFINSYNTTLELNEWNFITCTYDNSLGSANLKIYVNAVVGTNADLTEAINLSATLKLGDTTTDFKGYMRDFRWWTTKALSQAEIDDLYEDAITSPNPDYWLPINEGTGNPIDNVSGTKVGTLTNGAAWNTSALVIPDKYTAPTGVEWNEISSPPTLPNVGKLSAQESFPIWVWLNVPANAIEILDDYEVFGFRFNIPQGGTGTGGGGTGSGGTPGTYHYEPYQTFNGSGGGTVIEPDDPSLDLLQHSCAAWFRTSYDYTGGEGIILIKGISGVEVPGDNQNFMLKLNNTPFQNEVEGGFEDSSGGEHKVFTDGATWNDGQWHHTAYTYDGTILRLYMDGVQVHTRDDNATPETNAHDLSIGYDVDNPDDKRYWVGDLDEIRVWNTALTAEEIQELFNQGVVPQTSAIVYENTFGGSGGSGGSGGTGGNPPPDNSDYKIAIAGDWGCEPETDDVIDLIQSQGYDHVVGVGDNAYESAGCWTTRFTPLKSIMNSAYGNHEYSESGGVTPYKTFFGHSLTYFTYKFENIQFFVCDTNINLANGSAQWNFISNALTASQNDNTVTWRIAVMHDAWFGASSDHAYNEFDQVQAFHQLFQNNGVRIVCCGHNHNWQRTHMVSYNSSSPTSPTIVDNTSPYSNNSIGLIHVVSGTGGHDSGSGLYSLGSQPSFQAYQNRTHNGVWEIVASNNAQTLTCQFREIGGDTFDTFVITA
ncbi:MAG TPA: LamG-like jellyroll fold domain-containing protein [Nitrososphaeraceae archaeon]|nr:LamG-like jellyroll fold domain-containing protein [Nitrososphaeraceae archaeon]